MKPTYERLEEIVVTQANQIMSLDHQLRNAELIMAGKNARIAELEAEVGRLKKPLANICPKCGKPIVTGLDEWEAWNHAAYECEPPKPGDDNFITDGFGSYWPSKCPNCGAPMQVVRPGDCRCSAECYTIDARITK